MNLQAETNLISATTKQLEEEVIYYGDEFTEDDSYYYRMYMNVCVYMINVVYR
jgi:hypothetical protein